MTLSSNKITLLILLSAYLCIFPIHAESDPQISEQSTLDIMFLGSATPETPWTKSVSGGLLEVLQQKQIKNNYYSDHLEAARFEEDKQYDLMYRYLKEKFRGRQPDLFVTAGHAAGIFSKRFPDLFAGSRRILIHSGQPPAENMVIIEGKIDYTNVVNEMVKLVGPQKVMVIGDTDKPSFAKRHKGVTGALEMAGVEYKELVNQPLDALLVTVSQLSVENVIFINPISREFDGKLLKPYEVVERLHKKATVPIFSSEEVLLGHGIVGGYLFSAKELGKMAGSSIAALIRGEDNIKVQNGYGYFYDWREITRWGLENRLEKDAELRFKQLSLWEEYRTEIIFIVIVFALLIIMVAAMMFLNRQLIKAREVLKLERDNLESRVESRTQELSILHEQAEKLARIDPLTELYNRRAFFEQGERIHKEVVRYGKSYSIMMLDIDFFKSINDKFGHSAGDKVINIVARTIKSIVRDSDLVARIGGEEFAVILLETSHETLSDLAERMRREISETTVKIDKLEIKTSISIGLAEYEAKDQDVDSVLDRADKALYQAKDSGRNRVKYYFGGRAMPTD